MNLTGEFRSSIRSTGQRSPRSCNHTNTNKMVEQTSHCADLIFLQSRQAMQYTQSSKVVVWVHLHNTVLLFQKKNVDKTAIWPQKKKKEKKFSSLKKKSLKTVQCYKEGLKKACKVLIPASTQGKNETNSCWKHEKLWGQVNTNFSVSTDVLFLVA